VGSERRWRSFDASVERELLGPVLSSRGLDVGAAAADDGRLRLVGGGPRGVGGEQTRLAVVDAADE